MSRSVKLTTPNQEALELPVLEASIDHDMVDIRALTKSIGLLSFNPGFVSTVSCESKVTYIDGDKGLLYYRGYPIEQLAEKSDYLEVCYLLTYGELPIPEQREEFDVTVSHHTMVYEQLTWLSRGFRHDAHPMAMMVGVVGALSASYQDSLDITNLEHRKIAIHRSIFEIPTIAAMCYRYSNGLPFDHPKNNLSYAENFLHMAFATPCEEYKPNPVLARALDRIFILHTGHEQNASTPTVRLAGSSGANPSTRIAAGIVCLWGASYGGVSEAALKMLDEIGDVSSVAEYMEGVKQRKYRLMGSGHRVYRNMDPHTSIICETRYEILKELGLEDSPKFRLMMELEQTALEDPFFVERELYPNADFYSGIVLSALGIPIEMFIVTFALFRSVGWISHWHEMISDSTPKIGRLRQLYAGAERRDYVPVDRRQQTIY